MLKEEYIAKYGKEAYIKKLKQNRIWGKAHRKGKNKNHVRWNKKHPERIAAHNREHCRKGGKRYERVRAYNQRGLQGERGKLRRAHGNKWRPYKRIIAPDSQLHHQWIPKIAAYTGIALVEVDAHIHGFIEVIQILEGKITLLTEEEIRKGGENKE